MTEDKKQSAKNFFIASYIRRGMEVDPILQKITSQDENQQYLEGELNTILSSPSNDE